MLALKGAPLLMFSVHNPPEVADLLRITGADGFVRSARARDLIEAITAVLATPDGAPGPQVPLPH